MNKLLLLLFVLVLSFQARAQFTGDEGEILYGNEWINFDQQYFKIPVAEDGIYRISIAELEAAGVPTNQVQGKNFQMFHNGKEYPIYTSNRNQLADSDFIEFYGRKNRGELDRVFYEDPETMQLNPEYSLFTDTAAYFLTWNDEGDNIRVKETTTDLSGNFLPAEKFYMHKERVVRSESLHKPTHSGGDNVRYSHFDVGEGFAAARTTKREVTLSASSIYEDGPDPSAEIRFTTNATSHVIKFSVNGNTLNTYNHFSYRLRQEKETFDLSLLKASNKITLEGTVDQFDYNYVAVVDLNYPREFDFNNKNYFEFFVAKSFFEKYVEVENFDGDENAVIYDPASGERIIPVREDGKLKFIVPGANRDRSLIVYNTTSATKTVEQIKAIIFTDFGSLDEEYIIISHPKLRQGPTDNVQAYADYRSSAQGGSFKTIIVNVEELYDQFSYGINRHSYSVKNFVNFVKENWSDPKYVFIIGKGREYANYRKEGQINDPLNQNYYVPTFGYPGSDNYLASNGINSTVHSIPLGRVAIKELDDLTAYFEKVKEHENFENKPLTIEDRLWKKRIMHLVGAETTLQASLGSYLQTMEEIIENNQYGAKVITYKKSSTETIQEADSDALLNSIDAGLSVLTFFGHSSVGTFDFNIDDVNKLQNTGKYPLVISLGCYSGNIHTASYGISEQYVVTGGRGAIGFIASSSAAYVPPQGNFGIKYYEKLGGEYYGKSLGEILVATLAESDDQTTLHTKILNEQITLHGDPALQLHQAIGPDYIFDYQSFTTEPNIIESNQKEFELKFRVANLGKFVEDSLNIILNHYNSSGVLNTELDFNIHAPKFDTLISIIFPNEDNSNVGKNVITGELDFVKEIDELPNPGAENNNSLVDNEGNEGFVFYSINNSAIPVSPCDYGILTEEKVVLKASTYNALAKEVTTYVIEIDTTANFDSPIKERKEIQSSGGLMEFEPSLNFTQGKSYYWRVSPDSINQEIGYKWEDASFVYLPNSSNGWNQSHYYQFLDNEYDGISLEEDRTFAFDTSGFFIKIFNSIWDPNTTGYQYNFETYAVSVRPWNFMQEGVAIVVGDSITGNAWINSGGDFGSIKTSNFGSFRCFGFPTNTFEDREKVVNFLENVVPEGNFVWFFTVLKTFNSDFKPELWDEDHEVSGKSIYSTLENNGAILAREMVSKGSVPYTFIFQKGKETLSEEIGEDKKSFITSTAFIPIRRDNGLVESKEIGPAKHWDKIVLNGVTDSNQDTTILKVYGLNSSGEFDLLLSSISESEVDISQIDAERYPKIKLRLEGVDKEKLTPMQVNLWRVFYESFPDINININETFVFNSDTLEQGEELFFKFQIDNISTYDSDSISIDIDIIDSNNGKFIFNDMIDAIAKGESIIYEYRYPTRDLLGRYQLSLNINGGQEVIEKNYFNNFGVREFVVIKDVRNPILDLTFDGNKILDGDIVSPTPMINISLKDENEYLLLDDPSILELALIHPDNAEEVFTVADERLKFLPATDASDNEAIFELRPSLEQDGIYTIKILASDVSKNISGDINLERSFEVINEQLISNVLNYPNPFSTSTEFIFTLTGSEIPDEIKIEIMTISGKVVKEIFKEELGELKIGLNRTSYKWNGTDEFGNKLANGVYLYRVIAKQNSEKLSKFEIENTNEYFKNSLGKLVILR